MPNLITLDLFCGTGGFSKGFENHGAYSVAFGIDSLPVAAATFRLNHPRALALHADIRAVSPSDVGSQLGFERGQVDIIVGGPPCQGFSSIRPNRSSGDEDQRNGLFEDFANYVAWFHPKAFVLENVVGLLTHRHGRTLEQIQTTFQRHGYETDWHVVNAAHFGVPQKRERFIMIGCERGLSPIFPETSHDCDVPTIGYRDRTRMLMPRHRDLFNQDLPELPPAVTVADAIDDLPKVAAGKSVNSNTFPAKTPYQHERRANSDTLTLHISTSHTPRMLEIIRHSGPNISHIPEHLITSGFSSCYSRLSADEPSTTITVNFVHPASNRCIHPTQDRALTLREGARLQSFDDDYQFAGTRTQIAKQIGNAVPPLLGRAIAAALAETLGAERESAGKCQQLPTASPRIARSISAL